MATFTLGDDGTLDTVLVCDTCGLEERYNYDGCEDQDHKGACECYNQFVAAAIDDRNEMHECPGPQQEWECCTSSIGPTCQHR